MTTAPIDLHSPPSTTIARPARPWLGAVVALGAAAAVRPMLPAVGPLCPLRRLTGIPCPACGASACAVALSRGDLAGAVFANPFVLVAFAMVFAAAFVPAARKIVAAAGHEVGNHAGWFVPLLALSWLWQLHRYDYL